MKVLKRADVLDVREFRMVGEGRNQIVPKEDAFRAAEEAGLDLVCVSEESNPLVVRIQDFKKLKFERKKTLKAQKAKVRSSALKEVQFKLRIAEHDLEVKLKRVKEFLDRGDKVKATVRLRGRERATPERARDLINEVVQRVGGKVSQSGGPPTVAIIEPGNSKES